MTDRQRLEQIANLYIETHYYEKATDILFNQLIQMAPNQWSYWIQMANADLRRITNSQTNTLHDDTYNIDSFLEDNLIRCNDIISRFCGDLTNHQDLSNHSRESSSPSPTQPQFLRAPFLFRVEIYAQYLKHYLNKQGTQLLNQSSISLLSSSIIDFGQIFAPITSCCFQDLRPYLTTLMEVCSRDSFDNDEQIIPKAMMDVLVWAKSLRESNDPSIPNINNDSPNSSDVHSHGVKDDNKKRRKLSLRCYITSVKICMQIWSLLIDNCPNNSNQHIHIDLAMMDFVPDFHELVLLWEDTLSLADSPSDEDLTEKDKNLTQKEFLPGDDLILLAVQVIQHLTQHQNDMQPAISILTAALLEYSITKSPHNPYLKICALQTYSSSSHTLSITRAWEMFESLAIRHIQLDSCSYLILNKLYKGGLYKEAIQHAGSIISLHNSNAKDIGDYLAKSFENGNISKGHEMIEWERNKMSRSIQLLEAKGIIMDLATLLYPGDTKNMNLDSETNSRNTMNYTLGLLHGICGRESDYERTLKIVKDSNNNFSAPSLLKFSTKMLSTVSDNRDSSINQFEILCKTKLCDSSVIFFESSMRKQFHDILVRATLLIQIAKPPKKGKVICCRFGSMDFNRCQSLLRVIKSFTSFIDHHGYIHDLASSTLHPYRISLSKSTLDLAKTLCITSTGIENLLDKEGDNLTKSNDTLATRESLCIPLLISASEHILNARNQLKIVSDRKTEFVCSLLADHIVPLFSILEMVGNLFSSFGWGKRKKLTKASAGNLAVVAKHLHDLVTDMENVLHIQNYTSSDMENNDKSVFAKQILEKTISELESFSYSTQPNSIYGDKVTYATRTMSTYFIKNENWRKMLEFVTDQIVLSQQCTRERVLPFLVQIKSKLMEYNANT
eukprot:CAMPEP_0184868248 /NCGR_PEP_ID=MMETSP0580-20130426/29714_1 /TAXON_ID=1118495 /ORGANISM="Dactyliosolen fragilissimus" /LENGTH=897 /DNA_ID=CAMNT_0027369017 /DNA_START=57 /DNA_END=2750 /DNA_ORIENTATION=+